MLTLWEVPGLSGRRMGLAVVLFAVKTAVVRDRRPRRRSGRIDIRQIRPHPAATRAYAADLGHHPASCRCQRPRLSTAVTSREHQGPPRLLGAVQTGEHPRSLLANEAMAVSRTVKRSRSQS